MGKNELTDLVSKVDLYTMIAANKRKRREEERDRKQREREAVLEERRAKRHLASGGGRATVSTVISLDTLYAINRIAEREDVTTSAAIRGLIERGLKEYGQDD